MRRHLGLGLLVAVLVLVGCTAHKRCDGPNGSCGHPWFNHPWLNREPQQPAYPLGPPPGSVAVPPPGAGVYAAPPLATGPAFGPTPDMNAPAVPPGGVIR